MQCVTQRGSSRTCCSVRVVANIIMRPVSRLVPRPSSGQDGSAQSVKCARLAGESRHMSQIVLYTNDSNVMPNVLHGIYIIFLFKKKQNFWLILFPIFCNVLILHFLRQPGEDSKMLVCDACDKGYHTFCLQPAMDSLPSDPWKCRVSHICHSPLYQEMPLSRKLTVKAS